MVITIDVSLFYFVQKSVKWACHTESRWGFQFPKKSVLAAKKVAENQSPPFSYLTVQVSKVSRSSMISVGNHWYLGIKGV